ncbi:50S ribosomal protein L11 methyltransferase [Lachnospiraceae bacterium MD1]|uniref:Ribosomal protein L11 methyltransferase n=1 Tax=Variimorphobacter saccharofermentans TaxID=2755051 RepID=A0A839K277_9FIRM|nr:50S ribosomal protein L11 methyltransferase [Variimorphobacter saccharofermentans]MBB2183099.1 50S ribosomal protein L11 methyltransferase [Variimorphobacter saccharofermentans]
MKWKKFTLETTTEAVDLVCDMLNDLGIAGVEINDNVPITEEEKRQMFVDILPDMKEDDGISFVSFYLDEAEDAQELLSNVREGLKNLSELVNVGSGSISTSTTEDKDWINNWKQFFKPFRVDDSIIIKPTWEKLEEQKEGDIVIELDPGISFGTGSHETTKLCIIALKEYLQRDSVVLDAGSGSGILSIIAKKLGAKEVLGIDIDPSATKSAKENALVNNLDISDGSLNFVTGNMIENNGVRSQLGLERFDLVVANILADVIVPLTKVIGENMKPNGIFICSGIINTKEDEVREALENNHFKILKINKMNDWVSFVAQK